MPTLVGVFEQPLAVAEVARHRHDFGADPHQPTGQVSDSLRITIDQANRGAALGEEFSDRAADAHRGACHQRGLAFKILHLTAPRLPDRV